jgi:hypothetical protein
MAVVSDFVASVIRRTFAAAPAALLRSAAAASAELAQRTTAPDASRAAAATSARTGGATISAFAAATASGDYSIAQRGASLPHVGRAASTVTVRAIARPTSICAAVKAPTAVAVLTAARRADCAFAANEHRQRLSRRYRDRSLYHTA